MTSNNGNTMPTDVVKELDVKTVFCDENVLIDAYAAMQISNYFKEGFHFEKDQMKLFEDLCEGFKRGTTKWFPLNTVLGWLNLLDPELQQRAGQLWTSRIAQDLWGDSDKKEQITLFDAFVEISNIYQVHHRHKEIPTAKVVGELTVSMHPEKKYCLIISEIDSPWTGYYYRNSWHGFRFLTGAWQGVVLGFSGKEGNIVVEESGPYFRRILVSA